MKRENGDAPARLEAQRKTAQECIERAEFIVHCNSECLEDSAHAIFVSTGAAHAVGEFGSCRWPPLQQGARDVIGLGLIGVLAQQSSECRFFNLREKRACGLTAL